MSKWKIHLITKNTLLKKKFWITAAAFAATAAAVKAAAITVD